MILRRAALAVAACAAALGAPAPAVAQGGCGGVKSSEPRRQLGDFRAPLIIGDSVLLGAIPQVARQGYEVNARGCRSWSEGARLVRRRQRNGTQNNRRALPYAAPGTFLGPPPEEQPAPPAA